MTQKLDHNKYYRLPWTLSDNAVSWLEPTKKCNIYCDGCYSESSGRGHKPLNVVKEEVLTYMRLRKFDAFSIAGGDPLIYPDILELVRFISEQGIKPILNTNGLALTEEFLKKLKKAGLVGITFHIDSKQNRPKWNGKTELELNELRLYYAQMLDKVGGIVCGFNSTIYPDTLKYVAEMVKWADKHINLVNLMVFIAFRAVSEKQFDYYVHNKKLANIQLPYSADTPETGVGADDIYHAIKKEIPEFESSAYLNGTEDPGSIKWLLSNKVGTNKQIFGYLGPKVVELAQSFHHFKMGNYLAYPKRWVNKLGRAILLLAPIDKTIRKIGLNYLRALLKNPLNLFKTVYLQNVMFIQPIDFMPDGRQNMCDGCPDMVLWNGKLVWSCRLEEPLKYGCFVQTSPKQKKNIPVKSLESSQENIKSYSMSC